MNKEEYQEWLEKLELAINKQYRKKYPNRRHSSFLLKDVSFRFTAKLLDDMSDIERSFIISAEDFAKTLI